MGIFDRLKPQPRWKHSDPAVRLQAIPELGDPAELAALAEQDPDARVRTAALSRIDDTAVLGRVAGSDADQAVRDVAADRLLAQALDEANPGAEAAARLLTDARRVSTVARSTAADGVRAIALAALTDERALGVVARQAKVEATALAAVARLATSDELLGAALNSVHRDVALEAFDRFAAMVPTLDSDVPLLKSIEARAQQKAVGRRARALLQAIEDAENARRLAAEEKERQEWALCAAVEGLATGKDPERISAELARLRAAWEAMASTDANTVRRFEAGAEAAGRRADQRRGEIAAALEEERRRDEALGVREELCQRVEAIAGDGEADALVSIEAQWQQLPALAGYEREVALLATRFAAVAKACRQRLAQHAALQQTRAALESLVAEAESLSSMDAAESAGRWAELTREARELSAVLEQGSRSAPDLVERLAAVSRERDARERAARNAAEKARAEHLAKLTRLVARIRTAAEAGTFALKEGERLLSDIAAAIEKAASGEARSEVAEAVAALRDLHEKIEPRVKELRDLDKWRRFANGEQQERLIAAAEAIVASLKAEEEAGTASDLAATAKALREMQAEWQKVADGPLQGSRRSWARFKEATDFLRSRCEVYFVQQREERSRNLAARVALLAQAEELVESTDWAKTAARFQELQKAWDECGPVSGESARSLAPRFRAACGTFFGRRREAMSSLKQEWKQNLASKEALCERAEQLAESTEWDAAASELKQLQADWKTIGPVRRDRNEAIWTRFRSAADKFFERYHNRHRIAEAAQLAEVEALVVALETLAALEESPDDLGAQVQALRTTISNAPQLDGPAATALHHRWLAALAALVSRSPAAFQGTDLDPVANRERRTRLLAKVESLLRDEAPAATEAKTTAELLAERLRTALASNALGARPDETKWRSAGKAVEDAQDAWSRLLQLPDEETAALEERFRAACRRVTNLVKQHVRPSSGFDGDPAAGGPRNRPDRKKGRPDRR